MVMSISDRIIVLNYGCQHRGGNAGGGGTNEEVIKAYLGARRVA